MSVQILGKVGMVLKGEYNNATTYQKLDVVTYNGQSYAAKGETLGNLPTNTAFWQLLAEKGYTPVKGTDYYTSEDIVDMENDVKQAVEREIPDVSNFITKDVNNLTNYTLKTNTGSLIDLSINTTTYVITLSLKDQDGNAISTDTIDLPLESVVVSGNYDSTNQKIVLTLQNGNTVDIPVGSLISGLQTEITSQNKLASDLIDDTNSGNKFVTTSEKNIWNGKQDALTFDNTPIINSNNPVKSGGVYNELLGKVNTADVEEKDLLITYEDTTTETVKLVVYK